MPIEPINNKKMYEKIADALMAMIRSGELKPGDRVAPVGDLAAQFGVGRSAVREALSALRAMGLIDMRQGEGTYIRSFSPETFSKYLSTGILMEERDIDDLLDVRELLESEAARRAATSKDSVLIQEIFKALDSMKEVKEDASIGEEADLAFHLAVARASGNRLLAQLMASVSEAIAELMRETRRIWIYSQDSAIKKMYQEHRMIVDAIAEGVPDRARQAMLDHLASVRQIIKQSD
ncbi:FadR/GntR family transcriptional regulator [Sporolactobacillus spathodeae]